MSLLTSSIDLDMIEPPSPSMEAQFQNSELEYFAKLMLKSGDTVRPIILSKISPISFRILEGYFEYYAALKAQEIDEQFTAIRAYVAPKESESSLLEQYHFLRDRHSNSAPDTSNTSNRQIAAPHIPITTSDDTSLNKVVERLESSLNQTLQTLFTDLSTKIATLDQRISDLSSQTVNLAPSKLPKKPLIQIDPAKQNKILEDMNTMSVHELQVQIAKSNPTPKNIIPSFAESIHKGRQTKLYTSLNDVFTRAKVAKLGDKTFDKIINAWQ